MLSINPKRNSKNYRYYSNEDIITAARIKTLQEMGFSLKEIKQVLIAGIEHLEKNISKLTSYKNAEIEKIQLQLCKIKRLENTLQATDDFDLSQLDKLTLLHADDRNTILNGIDDLVNRTVVGKSPRIEIVNEIFFKHMQTNTTTFEHDDITLITFSEYFKIAPKSYYVVFEIEELVCYFFISITEDDLAKFSDIFNSNNTSDLSNFANIIMDNYSKAWKSVYMPISYHQKKITNDPSSLSKIFSNNDVLLNMRFKRIKDNDDIFNFTIGAPINIIKAVDSATPNKPLEHYLELISKQL